jgi:hypothetical protein
VRIKFTGPDGAKYAGLELVAINDTQRARTDALAAAEFATGLELDTLVARTKVSAGLTTHLTLFMTLRNAGFWVTWDEIGALTGEHYEVVVEPSDRSADDDAEDTAEDPTPARTVSVPGAGPLEPEQAKAPKGKGSGSRSRSTAVS